MLAELCVPYADTRAGQLTWQLGLDVLPALATLDVTRFEARLELRLLGASHQLLVRNTAGALACSETVACHVGGAPLPLGGGTTRGPHHLRTTREHLGAAEFADRVAALIVELADRRDALVGRYPGHPLAVTALAVHPGSQNELGWSSWHAYPQTGELVATTTRLTSFERARCA